MKENVLDLKITYGIWEDHIAWKARIHVADYMLPTLIMSGVSSYVNEVSPIHIWYLFFILFRKGSYIS